MAPQLKTIGQLLTPSWLSGLIAVVTGLAVVIAAAAALHYSGSDLPLLREQAAQSAITENSESVNGNLDANELVSDLPLLILWGGVGVLVYSLIMQVIKVFTHAADLRHELTYVHADRQQLLRQVLTRFAIRAAIFAVWLLYIQFTIHTLIPYVVALAYAGSGELGWLADAAYLLAGVCLMAIAVHLHVVMLRLLLLRPRVTGQPIQP